MCQRMEQTLQSPERLEFLLHGTDEGGGPRLPASLCAACLSGEGFSSPLWARAQGSQRGDHPLELLGRPI